VLAALVLAAVPGAARAQAPDTGTIGLEPTLAVIEVYVKGVDAAASPEYSKSVAFSMGSTGRYAVMEREEVGQRFRSVLITPVKRLQMERLESIERMVREGDQLVYTDPKAAVDVLNRARGELESIAEGLAANDRLRHEFLKTQMLLARSHLDSGNEPKATEILREVISLYGDGLEVTERDYHPRLVALFKKVRVSMANDRNAALSVDTVQPGCEVVLDGRPLSGETPREYRGLYPGVHHVQVRCGAKESMIRRVNLKPNASVRLVIDVGFENALTVEGGRLGLIFETPGEVLMNAVPYAAKFGSLVNADLVVVHGFADKGTRADLKARLVDVKRGVELKNASVPAKTDVVTPSSVRKVVQVLAATDAVKVADEGSGGDEGGSGRMAWYKNYWGWILCGVGAAGIGVGGYFVGSYFSHRSNATAAYTPGTQEEYLKQFEYKKSEADKANKAQLPAGISMGVGGAALAGGIVLFILTDKIFPATASAPGPRLFATPAVGRDNAGFMATLVF
jgi:hypothetical protein